MERFADNIIWRPHVLQSAGRILLTYSAAAVAGLLAGFIGASGQLGLIAIFVGLLIMAVVVSYRNLLLWFIIIGGLVITGVAQLYLPGAKYLRYIFPLAAGVLSLHAIMDYMRSGSFNRSSSTSAVVFWPLAFLAIALLSTVANWDGIGVAVIGLKGYFQMWVFFFAFILIQWKREIINSLPKVILGIALLQLPFVLHQYFFLVPMRMRFAGELVPVDVVAGTFGATLFGGGANAVLAAFLLIVFACLLGLWKHGALSGTKLVVLSLILIFPVFINEAKISVVYLAVIFITLFYRDIIDRPLRFIAVSAAATGIIALLLTALTLLHPTGKLNTWSDLFNFIYEGQTASISERSSGGGLTRWTALTFWAQEHVSANPLNIAIGHGPGASRVQEGGLNLAETLAEKRYGGLGIGYTAVSALLWDTGILGLVTVLGFFFAVYRTAGKLTARYRGQDAFRAGIFDGLRAGVLILAVSLAHKDFFASNIPFQTLVLLVFGYLVIASNQPGGTPQGHKDRLDS